MSTVRPGTRESSSPAVPTVRRLVVFVLLFVLVLIGASGVGGLFERLFVSGTGLAGNDVGSLARSLAFGLVGGCLAAVLWWLVWRRQGEEAERSSVAWGLYVIGVYIVALITAVTAVLGAVSQLIGLLAGAASGAVAEGLEWRSSLATGVVWAAVWAWHRWMWQHRGKGPRRLDTVPALAGSVFGLLVGAGGAVTALGSLLDAALRGLAGAHDVGSPWWFSALQSLIWAGGGFLVWWWHWVFGEARHLSSPLANVAAAVFGVLGGCITAMAGAITTVFVLLRLILDRSEDMIRLVDPLGPAMAAAAVGCLVWRYHSVLTAPRSEKMRETGLLLASGVAVVAAASGVGVVVNAALGFAETTLAGTGTRTLLLGGISALIVGGAVWWRAWMPADRRGSASADDAGGADGADGLPSRTAAGRRIYLVAIFGISAVVALIALLLVGYQAFEYLLDPERQGNLVGRIRAPLGLLTATALVATYHYSVWRRERAVLQGDAPSLQETGPLQEAGRVQDAGPVLTARRTIGQVVLVTGSDHVPLSHAIREATGADVTVWLRSGLPAGPDPGQSDPRLPDAGMLMAALEGVSAERVLVVVGPGGRIDVIPVQDHTAS
ncbi:DUF5671 domain-containing protein [Arthrobacter sp. FW305-BF8]|uniref:DUF5671 domain-containing protein n=1 Tax=Arthrobacter sp. FW305-BF8 TaxID=2879617 RepID=UPI001F3E92F0|nr:DUF5671 domain-containing protein [Arthrobacter sp. FW305-BF8]UKA52630.1 DUF5671 domain-containing protein [Arthrobacter sp. FW305-BF8]